MSKWEEQGAIIGVVVGVISIIFVVAPQLNVPAINILWFLVVSTIALAVAYLTNRKKAKVIAIVGIPLLVSALVYGFKVYKEETDPKTRLVNHGWKINTEDFRKSFVDEEVFSAYIEYGFRIKNSEFKKLILEGSSKVAKIAYEQKSFSGTFLCPILGDGLQIYEVASNDVYKSKIVRYICGADNVVNDITQRLNDMKEVYENNRVAKDIDNCVTVLTGSGIHKAVDDGINFKYNVSSKFIKDQFAFKLGLNYEKLSIRFLSGGTPFEKDVKLLTQLAEESCRVCQASYKNSVYEIPRLKLALKLLK